MERTYTGPQTGSEDVVEHMKSCNPRGPLIIQVAKLFPKSDVSSFGEAPSLRALPAPQSCMAWAHHLQRAGYASCSIVGGALSALSHFMHCCQMRAHLLPPPLCTTDRCVHSCRCLRLHTAGDHEAMRIWHQGGPLSLSRITDRVARSCRCLWAHPVGDGEARGQGEGAGRGVHPGG